MVDQRTAIVDNQLFIASGNYTFDDDGQPLHNTSSMYWIPLNRAFDVSGPIDLAYMVETKLPHECLTGGKTPISGGFGGTFFYDRTMLYPYAAMVGGSADGNFDASWNNAIWSFNTTDESWKLVQVMGGQIAFGNNSEGVHASIPETGTSFYTGGWTMAYNGTNNGTVKFQSQSVESDAPQWSFTTPVSGIPGPDILKGSMVYVRKGRAGVLVAFGGYQTAYEGVEFAEGWDWDRRPLTDIFIYDIFYNVWYQQTATGDIPEPRTEFCAGVSAAPDDSSFQITIHGGWDQLGGHAFNDVYVLSIPSFRWIKVDDSNNPDLLGSDAPGRNRHKCDVWKDSQLIVSGGEITLREGTVTSLIQEQCNPTYPPIKVLDTSTYTWRTEFDPDVEYSVPNVVTAVIGGRSSGGATVTSPSEGWNSEELGTVFSQTVARDIDHSDDRTRPPDIPTESGGQESGRLGAGAIAEIVVALIIAAAAILTGIFVWKRKKRPTNSDDTAPASVVTPLPGPAMVETFSNENWQKAELDASNAAPFEIGEQSQHPDQWPQPYYSEDYMKQWWAQQHQQPIELSGIARPAELPSREAPNNPQRW